MSTAKTVVLIVAAAVLGILAVGVMFGLLGVTDPSLPNEPQTNEFGEVTEPIPPEELAKRPDVDAPEPPPDPAYSDPQKVWDKYQKEYDRYYEDHMRWQDSWKTWCVAWPQDPECDGKVYS